MLAGPLSWTLDALDHSRRLTGRVLDTIGLGPVQTPSRVVFAHPGFVLKTFDSDSDASRTNNKFPPILIIPAPIKRAYIWDLAPGRSVVRAALRRGWRVYLLEWRDPGPADRGWGLDHYADEFPSAAARAVACATGGLSAREEDTGGQAASGTSREAGSERVVVFSHSLGGTLAAIWASLHPEQVAAMVLLESPLDFGQRDDAFAPLVAAMPSLDFRRLLGNVPGSFLDVVSAFSAPEIFQTFRLADSLLSLADPAAARTHWQVERWSCDEFTLPGRLFSEVVDRLYRDNQYMTGRLEINGQIARPAAISAPVLSVIEPHSRLITPDMVLAFHALLPDPRSRVLHYPGEVGTGLSHVGPIVGTRAHRDLWPETFRWVGAALD